MAVMKISTPKALLWQNLDNLRLRADKKGVIGGELTHIEPIQMMKSMISLAGIYSPSTMP
jgi:hypothetical protein